MNISYMGLLVCFISSLSFLIGYIIKRVFNKREILVTFSIGLAFVVLIGLALLDLLPECISIVNSWYLIIIYVLIGVLFLKLFDYLVPHHEHSSKHNHIEHISTVTCTAIVLHNIIECTLMYTTSLSDMKSAILMAVGVACHNVPLSIEVNSLTKSNKKEIIMTLCLVVSGIIGGLLLGVFNVTLNESILGILMCITLGMIVYITLFELLCEVKENFSKKSMKLGILVGIVLVLIIFML